MQAFITGGWMLNTVESILVMVDFQGKLAEIVDRSDLVLPNALRMVKGCQALGIPIIPTVQVPEKLGPIIPELGEALAGIEPIAKSSFSALRTSEFLVALEESSRRQVILMGIEAHVCVLQTGLDLLDAGYEVYALSDGVFSRTAENHQLALQCLHDAGAFISSAEIALFEMIRTSEHPQFRTISILIKSSGTTSDIS
jgi:nicotinamidase-related amidase